MNENHLYSFGTQYIYQDIFTDERICPYDTKTFQMIQRISHKLQFDIILPFLITETCNEL